MAYAILKLFGLRVDVRPHDRNEQLEGIPQIGQEGMRLTNTNKQATTKT